MKAGDVFSNWTVIEKSDRPRYWLCKCKCGTIKEVSGTSLRSGRSRSCGCLPKTYKSGDRTSLIGKRFGRLTVIGFSHLDSRKKAYWTCRCDCGKVYSVQGYNLKSGYVRSCSCLRADEMADRLFDDITGKRFGKLVAIKCIKRGIGQKWLCKCDCGKEVEVFANNLKCNHTTSCGCYISSVHRSNIEAEIAYFVGCYAEIEIGKRIYSNKWGSMGREIDVFIPSKNIGIEYNGSIYHASLNSMYSNKPKNYHQEKFSICKSQGIRLISIFEYDWVYNKSKILQFLDDLLSERDRVYARACIVSKISKSKCNDFCDKYHIQGGSIASTIHYGLYFKDELISVMSFGVPRLQKHNKGDFELIRYCVKPHVSIVGGANKLLSMFEKEFKYDRLISYSDNDFFSGQVYKQLGFEEVSQTAPSYYWMYGSTGLKRSETRLSKLKLDYPEIYSRASGNKEDYIMSELKFCKVYRCGNTKWVKRPT